MATAEAETLPAPSRDNALDEENTTAEPTTTILQPDETKTGRFQNDKAAESNASKETKKSAVVENQTVAKEEPVHGDISKPSSIKNELDDTTITTTTTATITHLPSPRPSPSPSQDDSESASPAFNTFSNTNGHALSSHSLGLIDTTVGGVGLGMGVDLSYGLGSCAVSEADTDAFNSAVESSSEAPPTSADPQDTPRKESRRTSSSARRTRDRSGTKSSEQSSGIRRLSASKIQELAASPDSLPVAALPEQPLSASVVETNHWSSMASQLPNPMPSHRTFDKVESSRSEAFGDAPPSKTLRSERPAGSARTLTAPTYNRKSVSQNAAPTFSSRRNSIQPTPRPVPLNLESGSNFPPQDGPKSHASESQGRHEARDSREQRDPRAPSPMPPSFPIPPLSAPTFLQLELAAQRPSPLYVYHSYGGDIPYESSAVKFERLKNFLLLPPLLERTLMIGALACLDAWLWTLTILPMRFFLAVKILAGWWGYVVAKEVRWLIGFVWEGIGRMWARGRGRRIVSRRQSLDSAKSSEAPSRSPSRAREPLKELSANGASTGHSGPESGDAMRRSESGRSKGGPNGLTFPATPKPRVRTGPFHHKRTKSTPSDLSSFHKADILQFAVIVLSSMLLTQLDASRMYHFIRAQSAVKLYVIYNLVEVGDRLLSALGQDIFECLFSSETLSRNSLGRSKIMLPFGMFCLALVYNCAHVITLFYQVIALNVAVNSYSNALLTLLMSNQFVEIKGAVFKLFQKENLFQLTCADVVERFQLWIVLLIIGMRNVVEVGGLSIPGAGIELGDEGGTGPKVPLHNPSILPLSFTILPSWLWSGEVLSPFLVVIASEMLVDWIKHAYINKFNNVKPNFYSRVLDILCKDYYTNAFVTPTLTRRLGLPLLPLSTLFIRASFQTYHMFLATNMPAPLPPSTQTSLSVESSTPTSPAVTAALDRLDHIIRHALGRSVYGIEGLEQAGSGGDGNDTGAAGGSSSAAAGRLSWGAWSTDDAIALATLVMVVLVVWLLLLLVKLCLGMFLLRYSRDRYARMKFREHAAAAAASAGAGAGAKPQQQQQQQQQPQQPQPEGSFDAKGAKRFGGFGAVEVGDERRRWIYADDPEGLRKAREREKKMEERREKASGDGDKGLEGVMRYEMVAKRIW